MSNSPIRIAVCGFQHETNTFSPHPTVLADFERRNDLPEMKRGEEVLELVDSILPIAGAMRVLLKENIEIVPLLWCFATPAGIVESLTFEHIANQICDRLKEAGQIDGVFIELHGAMVVDSFEDGEGEILQRLRQLIGPEMPLAASLDLHGNVTHEMFELADYLDAYRRYPHTDMAETGARCARTLVNMVRTGDKPSKAMRKLDFLVPLNSSCTDIEPSRTLYLDALPEIETANGAQVQCSFLTGFHLSDIAEVGPSVLAYAPSPAQAQTATQQMYERVAGFEKAFEAKLVKAKDAIILAMNSCKTANGTIILAETQDNPGAGASAIHTGLLAAMIEAGAAGALLTTLIDPATAERAHAVGIGAIADFSIGQAAPDDTTPLRVKARVVHLADGPFKATGPMFKGLNFDFGRMALLETTNGVLIGIGSLVAQTADTSVIRRLGLEPAELQIIALKSSSHFRADFNPFSAEVHFVDSPGLALADPRDLLYTKKRVGLRI